MHLGDGDSFESESDIVTIVCPMWAGSGEVWVNCNRCNQWFDLKCTNVKKRSKNYCEFVILTDPTPNPISNIIPIFFVKIVSIIVDFFKLTHNTYTNS